MLTIGVWLLLIAFVIVHSDRFLSIWRGFSFRLLLRRALSFAILTGFFCIFPFLAFTLYQGSTHYEGLFKIPFLLGLAFCAWMLFFLMQDLPRQLRHYWRDPVAIDVSFKGFKLRELITEGLPMGVVWAVIASFSVLVYRTFRWSYEHRRQFMNDGGLYVLIGAGVALFALLYGSIALFAAVDELKEALENGRPVSWRAVAKRAIKDVSEVNS